MNEIVKRWWKLEMREENDYPGHWYSVVGTEFKSLGDAVWYQDQCLKSRPKEWVKPKFRILCHTHSKEEVGVSRMSETTDKR